MSHDLAAARFAGVYAAATTSFRDDGSVDFGQSGSGGLSGQSVGR